MIDKKLIYKDIKNISQKLLGRGFVLDTEKFLSLDKEKKKLQFLSEKIRYNRKKKSTLIKKKISENLDASFLIKEVNVLKKKLFEIEKKLILKKTEFEQYFLEIPNIPFDDVPVGKNNDKKISYWGNKEKIKFPIIDHVQIGLKNKEIDFVKGTKLTGSRFVVIKGQIALMYRALMRFMMDIHIEEHGYLEVLVPYLVNYKSLYSTGHLPKFSQDLFHIKTLENKKYFLIPTAEVPLTNLIREEIILKEKLPIKVVSCTPCFRSEAGSYGKETRGLIRMHQFDKVELVHFVTEKESESTLLKLVNHAEKILKLLKLPYRKKLLCSYNMSFGSAKTYDLDVWIPSQKKYIEVSSCSNMSDFQSRRMNSYYIEKNKKKLIHTLNGSGLAIGRTLIAVLENYQHSNGMIEIPEILRSYMKNLKFIENIN